MHTEKRKHTRYSQAGLSINVARPGITGFLKLNPTSECLDFSLSGIQFGSNQPFRVSEKLVLDMIVRDVEISEIPVVVVNSTEEDKGTFCTSVKFCFDTSRMQKPEIMHCLLQIEDQLRVANEFPT